MGRRGAIVASPLKGEVPVSPVHPRTVWCSILIIGVLAGAVHGRTDGQTQRSDRSGPIASFDPADFPRYDSATFRLLQSGVSAATLAARLRDSPDDPELPSLLARAGRHAEALASLTRAVEHSADRMAQALLGTFPTYRTDLPDTDGPEVLAIVALARTRLQELPREEAAAVARRLLDIETQFDRTDRRPYEERLRSFVATYAGTEAPALAQVDLIQRGPASVARLDALARFAKEHPGRVAAAKAIYQRGHDIAANATAFRLEPRGGDPTDRFLQVEGIVAELESGTYPDCQWVADARTLLVQFTAYRATYASADNIDTVLGVYRRLVMDRLPKAADPTDDSLNFVINTRMADLFERRGDRIGGVEGVYADIARVAPVPTAIRLAAALSYLRHAQETDADRPALFAKTIESLRRVHDEQVQPFSRRALANLGAVYFYQRDYPRAAAIYREYLSLYPDSPWAWVARIRLGQSASALGDLASAASAFSDAAETSGIPDAARTVSLAFEADTLAELGRVVDASQRAALALSLWDGTGADEYFTQAQQELLPGDSPYAVQSTTTITRVRLQQRVTELALSSASRGGAALEQARLELRRQPDRAIPTLRRAIAESSGTSLEMVARTLLHETILRQALEQTDVDRRDRNPDNARRLLESLGTEPIDFPVAMAGIARATLLSSQPDGFDEADRVMMSTLGEWRRAQPTSPTPVVDSVEHDVAAIRAEVFRPLGGGVYANAAGRWNAFEWPSQLPRFLIVNPDVQVRFNDSATKRVTLRYPIPGLDMVIFMNDHEQALMADVIRSIGGRTVRATTAVMQTPNQPDEGARAVQEVWNRYFPMRQGHWSGWEIEAYPQMTEIAFLDHGRTRATAKVTIGYSGTTVMLVKENGRWTARQLLGFWIT